MTAISLDEAWESLSDPPPPPRHSPPHVRYDDDAPESPPRRHHHHPHHTSSHPSHPSRSGRRAARRMLPRSGGGVDDVPDLATCLASLEQVSAELRELKQLFATQQGEQKMVLYVAIGVVILLLLFTAHSYSRLQYASDCMLHGWRR